MKTKNEQSQKLARLEQDLRDLENYMEEFTHFLPLAVAIVNLEGVIIDTNDAFASFTGYENPAASGSVLHDFFPEIGTLKDLLASLDGIPGGIRRSNLNLKTKGGTEKKVRITLAKRQDTSGRHTGYFVSIGDIGESDAPPAPQAKSSKKQSDNLNNQDGRSEDLTTEHRRHTTIIDGIRDGIIVVTSEGIVDLLSKTAAEMLSLKQESVIGKSVNELERSGLEPLVAKIEGRNEETERMELAEDTFEISVRNAETDGENYRIVTIHDISRDQFLEDMKLTFVSVAAHQIRTPLSSIRWSLELLVSQLKDEEQREVARRGYRSTQNILEIVNGILNLDKIQSGQDSYDFDSIDIIEIINSYVQEVQDHNQILDQPEIYFQQPIDPLPKVRGDQDKLRIVFRNLIDNAVKYTDSDGEIKIDTSVHITGDYSGDSVRISISDTGIGIPPTDQEKIFSKFYRADNARLTETDGSGIGLYITKRIVAAHDGTIWFESTEGEGTTFYIELPIAQNQD
ncbi:MAG: ATP-binding protein [Candidatus Paceibacterota bacterium]